MSEFYVCCNGKSLKDFDFNILKGKKWIGMNLAYRYWVKVDIFPTHYICLDEVVLRSNLEDIKKLVINKKCETFLFPEVIKKLWSDIDKYENIQYFEIFKKLNNNPFRYLVDWCTGSSGVLWAFCLMNLNLNEVKIHLLGADCNYVEFIPECKKTVSGNLIITETPKVNPNYFFDDYQRKGDIYNIPNTDRVHKKSWEDIRNIFIMYTILTKTDIKLMNYSNSGKLDHLFERVGEEGDFVKI